MSLLDELRTYLATTLDLCPEIRPVAKGSKATLPLYLTSELVIWRLNLLGEELLVALTDFHTKLDLARLAKQRESIQTRLGTTVVLVLPQIRSYERRRMIQKRVPFIVPHRQMYLPMLLMDLRETFAPRIAGEKKTMSWVAQVVLLRHLLSRDVTESSLARIAEMLGYTPMAISQAVDELVSLDLCERIRLGREKRIRFRVTSPELWRTALSHLRTPVKKVLLARELDVRNKTAPRAGLTALSDRTNIVSNTVLTIAWSESELREATFGNAPEIAEFDEDAQAIIEIWAYSPRSLTTGAGVDPLSLFLCLRNDPDERIQAALEQLIEEIA
jgi:DNA-binding MarR family transcriptional regulator